MAISYFMADPHLGHNNIVLGVSQWEDKEACRPFETLQEHDDLIINNINEKVGKKDILYIPGDFVFGGKDNIAPYRDRILCKDVRLIRGNHDLHFFKNTVVFHNNKYINVNSLFTEVVDLLDFKIGHTKIVLTHYPILSWHRQARGAFHLYGHVHKELNYHPQAFCVSAEVINYSPVSIEDIKQLYNERTN